jgi:hypothetical protein
MRQKKRAWIDRLYIGVGILLAISYNHTRHGLRCRNLLYISRLLGNTLRYVLHVDRKEALLAIAVLVLDRNDSERRVLLLESLDAPHRLDRLTLEDRRAQ